MLTTLCVPVVRQKLDEIVRQSPLWDGRVAGLQVTDTPDQVIELRALVSGRSPSQTWDLWCETTEKLIAFCKPNIPMHCRGSEWNSSAIFRAGGILPHC